MPSEQKPSTPSEPPLAPNPTTNRLTKEQVLRLAREVGEWMKEFPSHEMPNPQTEDDQILSRLD